jgi:hypothetical protein
LFYHFLSVQQIVGQPIVAAPKNRVINKAECDVHTFIFVKGKAFSSSSK